MRTLLLFLVLIAPVFGQFEGNPENSCREGFFTRESKDFRIGTVGGGKGSRSYFYGDENADCPERAGCRRKSYLVPGNEVIINRVRNGFACSWFSPAKGNPTVGWIKLTDLAISTPPELSGSRHWLGEWVFENNAIEFTDNKLAGFLNVTGNASWIGLNNNVHVGELDGRFTPENGVINYSDGDDEFDCKVTMRLLGRYLIVADNLKCGGVNVTFSGVYKKKKK